MYIDDSKTREDAYFQGKVLLDKLSDDLIKAYRTFNSVSDPVVLENCITEINELRSRRNTVLGELRQLEPTRKEKIWNSYQAFS